VDSSSTSIALPQGPPLRVCPLCDYALVGLPEVGICPECGRAYGRTSVYLYGNALGARRNAWNGVADRRRPVRLVLSQLALFAWLGFWIWSRRGLPRYDPFPYVWIAFIGFGSFMSLWRGFSDQGSGVVQVKLTPEGARQCTRSTGAYPYERNEKTPVVSWDRVKWVTFNWSGGTGALRISNRESFWRLKLDRDFVHANFSATEEDVIAIRQCLCRWLVQHGCVRALRYLEYDQSGASLPGGSWREMFRRAKEQ
jgi:hypothetical protein